LAAIDGIFHHEVTKLTKPALKLPGLRRSPTVFSAFFVSFVTSW
jgi:hypothetical protein